MRHAERHAARIDCAGEPAETSYVQPGLVGYQHAEAPRRLGDLPAALACAEASIRNLDRVHLRGRVHRLAGLTLILTAQREHPKQRYRRMRRSCGSCPFRSCPGLQGP
jgi:hypothetical protein